MFIDPKTLAKLQEVENLEDLQLDSEYDSDDMNDDDQKELGKRIQYEDLKEGNLTSLWVKIEKNKWMDLNF